MLLFEETWQPPREFPTLGGRVALDTETCDTELKRRGPGWAYPSDKGGVVGFSIARPGFKGYWPVAHATSGNVDRDQAYGWLADQLKRDDIEWCFANCHYDLGWLRREGLPMPKRILDVQIMGPLLDEYRSSYSLDALGRDLVGGRKMDLSVPGDKIWRTHPTIIGPYAERDAELTLAVAEMQWPSIVEQGLVEACELEHNLVWVLQDMRWDGVRVNVDRAERTSKEVQLRIKNLIEEVRRRTGVQVDMWVAESVARSLDHEGHKAPRTETGSISVTKEWLGKIIAEGSEIAPMILEMRKLDKVNGTFIRGQLLEFAVDGRLHPNYNALRSDRGDGNMRGTVSYRFSVDSPALQVLPKRDEETAEMVRPCIEPEEDEKWMSADFRQQEPRLALSFAVLTGDKLKSQAAATAELNNMKADLANWHFHKRAASIVRTEVSKVKEISLGRMYGSGGASIADRLGLSTEWREGRGGRQFKVAGPQAQALIDEYDRAFPWIKEMAEKVEEYAEARGYIRLLGGHRARFGDGKDNPRKAFNRLCQGSGAVQTKRAMVMAHRAGVRLKLQLHDEIGCSIGSEAEARMLQECMENSAPELPTPFAVEVKIGDRWG